MKSMLARTLEGGSLELEYIGWTSFLSKIRSSGAGAGVFPSKIGQNTPYGIVWLNPVSTEEWTPRWTPNARSASPHCQVVLVSVLVSIFRPNRVELVDFRDFGDFRRLV